MLAQPKTDTRSQSWKIIDAAKEQGAEETIRRQACAEGGRQGARRAGHASDEG